MLFALDLFQLQIVKRESKFNTKIQYFFLKTVAGENLSFFSRILMRWVLYYMPFARTVDHGAMAIVLAATSSELENVTGKYFSDHKISQSSEISKNEEAQQKLWDLSEEVAKLNQ
jgi:hypothetical protein